MAYCCTGWRVIASLHALHMSHGKKIVWRLFCAPNNQISIIIEKAIFNWEKRVRWVVIGRCIMRKVSPPKSLWQRCIGQTTLLTYRQCCLLRVSVCGGCSNAEKWRRTPTSFQFMDTTIYTNWGRWERQPCRLLFRTTLTNIGPRSNSLGSLFTNSHIHTLYCVTGLFIVHFRGSLWIQRCVTCALCTMQAPSELEAQCS